MVADVNRKNAIAAPGKARSPQALVTPLDAANRNGHYSGRRRSGARRDKSLTNRLPVVVSGGGSGCYGRHGLGFWRIPEATCAEVVIENCYISESHGRAEAVSANKRHHRRGNTHVVWRGDWEIPFTRFPFPVAE